MFELHVFLPIIPFGAILFDWSLHFEVQLSAALIRSGREHTKYQPSALRLVLLFCLSIGLMVLAAGQDRLPSYVFAFVIALGLVYVIVASVGSIRAMKR